MADTQRATTDPSKQLEFVGEPPQSKASATLCQDRLVSKSTGAELSAPVGIVLTGPDIAVLLFGLVGAILTLFLLAVGRASAIPTGMGVAITVLMVVVRVRGRANAELVENNSSLAAVLRREKSKAAETELVLNRKIGNLDVALKDADRKIAGLEKQIVLLRSQASAKNESTLENHLMGLSVVLPPDGKEAFSPILENGRVYELTIEGICALIERGSWGSKTAVGFADAFYRTGKERAFSNRHEWLHVDNKPLIEFLRQGTAERCHEDREAHRYRVRIKGSGQKVGISLRPYWQDKISGGVPSNLTLAVQMLPDGTPSPAPRSLPAEAPHEKSFHERRLEELRLEAHCESHFMDSAFQVEFAKREREKILQTLKKKWEGLYFKFMQDASLKKLAEEKAPEVIQWLEGRVKIVQLAEGLAVTPAQTAENKKPKRKLNAEEVRQIIVRKQAVQVDDKIARAKLKGEKIAKAKTEMDALPLDDDEKEQLKGELIRKILEQGEENEHGKNGDTV